MLAGSNCHVLRKTSTPAVALSKDVELSKPLPAVIVLMGSKAEKAEALGRRLAYMRSNMTLSKISRTKSMAVVVCRVYVPDWRGCRVELSSSRRGRSRASSQCREADIVKQAWV